MGGMMNYLFVCRMAALRSATASDYLSSKGESCKYCGTAPNAIIRPSKELLDWADRIIIFGRDNRSRLRKKFKGYSHKMSVWNIPDEFYYMEPALIAEIEDKPLT